MNQQNIYRQNVLVGCPKPFKSLKKKEDIHESRR